MSTPAPAQPWITPCHPELREKIAACRPDLLVLTGDIFDEFTAPEELEAFCSLFGEIDAPLGKYYVLGNHDLFHHWRSQASAVRTWEQGLAKAGVRLLEDTGVMLPCGVRIVGRKDYLYTNGRRFTAAQLFPAGRTTAIPSAGPRAAGL